MTGWQRTTRLGARAAGSCAVVAGLMLWGCGGDPNNRPGETGGGVVTVTGSGTDGGDTEADGDEPMPGDKLDLPSDDTDGPQPEEEPEEECASYTEAAENELQPADIIVVVDNSGSMGDEAAAVQANINSFSQQIIDSGVDAHVVLISSYPGDGHGICVDAPLGFGDCANNSDTNLPQFLHVDQFVASSNALERLLERSTEWMPVLRPDSGKHVVIVTDDESNLDAESFDAQFKALNPNFAEYKLHGIVSMQNCADAARIGDTYITLGQMTGGLVSDLCLQDFQPVFDLLATEVISGSVLSCEWEVPQPPPGEDFDPDRVNVEYDDGTGNVEVIGRVDAAADCADAEDGWYYDNPGTPSQIIACPQTCTRMQDAMMASIGIQLGCATIPAPTNAG